MWVFPQWLSKISSTVWGLGNQSELCEMNVKENYSLLHYVQWLFTDWSLAKHCMNLCSNHSLSNGLMFSPSTHCWRISEEPRVPTYWKLYNTGVLNLWPTGWPRGLPTGQEIWWCESSGRSYCHPSPLSKSQALHGPWPPLPHDQSGVGYSPFSPHGCIGAGLCSFLTTGPGQTSSPIAAA